MKTENNLLSIWLSLTHIQSYINDELERVLQQKYDMSLKEFYVLYFLSRTEDKKLRLHQLQEMVGLSQSAVSRLVGRMEMKDCGALQRNACEIDRRGIYTQITELGENKLQSAMETFNEVLQESLRKDHLILSLKALIKKI
ncbi:MarR family winged helix-turn-helix transcriptional regulator [Paenibacillus polymyxa]|uniref:MarR family winged helix-turn-helix transcriptional regulator n=1 Tax=Paenibacillus polymyxa TaxID=1406 RepID=UPI00234AD51E|nr:MarR family transcriptional regulator [Paenibacillus polymyxa]WCM60732.1 MarR family transcriptional regulator [Paenibacillus polymyxa]